MDFYNCDLSYPILGTNFLHHIGRLVDLKHEKMIDSEMELFAQGCTIVCPLFFEPLLSYDP